MLVGLKIPAAFWGGFGVGRAAPPFPPALLRGGCAGDSGQRNFPAYPVPGARPCPSRAGGEGSGSARACPGAVSHGMVKHSPALLAAGWRRSQGCCGAWAGTRLEPFLSKTSCLGRPRPKSAQGVSVSPLGVVTRGCGVEQGHLHISGSILGGGFLALPRLGCERRGARCRHSALPFPSHRSWDAAAVPGWKGKTPAKKKKPCG